MLVLLAFLLFVVVFGLGMVVWAEREAASAVEEFVERFPGRCPVCACHRFGLQNALTYGKPPPHSNCPEAAKGQT